MGQRRVTRAAPPSTLPGPLTSGLPGAATQADSLTVAPAALRRLRKWLLRLGPWRSTWLITTITTSSSIAIALIANAIVPQPPAFVWFTMTLSTGIPLLVSPPIAWFVVRMMFEADDARRVAERLAVTDPLTQAFNRRHFFHVGEREFAQVRSRQQALSVLLLDIDNFKGVNDQHGHAIGDQVLKQVAQTCMDGMREHDLLARFGGEEFVVLLPATGMLEAASLAERLRQAVELLAVAGVGGAVIRPTVSIGVATTTASAQSFDLLLAGADQAMYLAKRSGRNRVIVEPVTP